ncbi:hypothetical protein DFJ73DRAFT_254945 [Zopfochytrium polystomum]|nr:hypothetical protein DFJ73DRAFT_254945 [Zopfochytrium polystomum]
MVTGGYGLFCLVLIKSGELKGILLRFWGAVDVTKNANERTRKTLVPQAYMFITAFTLSFTYCVFLIIIMP